MTDEEITKEFSDMSIPAFVTGLLGLELKRKFEGMEIETDSLKLTDSERRARFSGRLRLLRKTLGLKQSDVAAALHISTQAYAIYETGKREPNLKNLIGIARTLKTSTDWLLGETPT